MIINSRGIWFVLWCIDISVIQRQALGTTPRSESLSNTSVLWYAASCSYRTEIENALFIPILHQNQNRIQMQRICHKMNRRKLNTSSCWKKEGSHTLPLVRGEWEVEILLRFKGAVPMLSSSAAKGSLKKLVSLMGVPFYPVDPSNDVFCS